MSLEVMPLTSPHAPVHNAACVLAVVLGMCGMRPSAITPRARSALSDRSSLADRIVEEQARAHAVEADEHDTPRWSAPAACRGCDVASQRCAHGRNRERAQSGGRGHRHAHHARAVYGRAIARLAAARLRAGQSQGSGSGDGSIERGLSVKASNSSTIASHSSSSDPFADRPVRARVPVAGVLTGRLRDDGGRRGPRRRLAFRGPARSRVRRPSRPGLPATSR